MADVSLNETTEVTIVDGSSNNGNELVVNSDGSLIAAPTDGKQVTYSAGFSGSVAALLATDVFTILGSATKTIRVTCIKMSATTTAGSGLSINLTLVKRSTADSGGTSTTATIVPHDSASAAGTAVIRNYTVNPTLGTAVGIVRSERLTTGTTGTSSGIIDWEFGTRPGQALVLRGTSEQLCMNFGTVTITGSVIAFCIEWTEE